MKQLFIDNAELSRFYLIGTSLVIEEAGSLFVRHLEIEILPTMNQLLAKAAAWDALTSLSF